MAFNKPNARQIRDGIISVSHLASTFNLPEDKLTIDWSARGSEILATKKVIDFVQVDGQAVTAASGSTVVSAKISVAPAADNDALGVVVADGKNKVIIRNAETGEPFRNADGKEVYGKLTHDGTDYTVSYFGKDGLGAEAAFTFSDAATIDFQFPQRFNLSTVSDTFAANEKFVDGAADVSARLDLEQAAKDIFGASYGYNQDGTATRAKTIVEEITDVTDTLTQLEQDGRLTAHGVQDYEVILGDTVIGTSVYTLTGGETYVAGDRSLKVFVNGLLQMGGKHYTETTNVDGRGVAVSFAPELLAEGDVIQLHFHK